MAQLKGGILYSGTHCLRHGMATLARKVGGMGQMSREMQNRLIWTFLKKNPQ